MQTAILEKRQMELAKKVSLENGFGKITAVAGFDVAYSGKEVFCSCAVVGWRSMEVIEHKTTRAKETFPYIPGFLAFREAPHIIRLYKKLILKPDIILIDGQGICHPRGIGLASHVGVLLDIPSIGVAKSQLCGEYEEGEGIKKLMLKTRHVGWVSKRVENPLFISPGHKVSINSSMEIVSHCTKEGERLPEPLRLAHLYGTEAKNNYQARQRDFEAHLAKAIRNEDDKAGRRSQQ